MKPMARMPGVQPEQPPGKDHTFPAPSKGWVTFDNIANPSPGTALELDNWFPTSQGIRLRKGVTRKATIAITGNVEALMAYNGGAVKKLFAATADKIFNVTNVADPLTIPVPDVTSQTSGYYSSANMGTVGGNYMYAVNGANPALLYDGTTWLPVTGTSVPFITGVATSLLSQVWTYKNRLFFTKINSKSAWFLPVDSIGGAALEVSMAGVFKKGGDLLFGASWSIDAGNGIDDKCVFVSTNGEVAVYTGSNPASATDWSLVGRYDFAKPLGKNCTMQAGGDLLVLTEIGIVPVSAAFQKDVGALSIGAVSRNIQPEWLKAVQERGTMPWQVVKWPTANMAIVAIPRATVSDSPYAFVVNLETGAWCRFPGYDAKCVTLHDGQAYYGNILGQVMTCEVGGFDDTAPYYSKMTMAFEPLGNPATQKHVRMMRATFRAGALFTAKLSAAVNYAVKYPAAPAISPIDPAISLWGTALWGSALWYGTAPTSVITKWVSVYGNGFAIAPQLQISNGSVIEADAELFAVHIIYEEGGVLV